MANKAKNPSNDSVTNMQDQENKKKGFDQGTGNNNTTAQDSRLKDNPDLKNDPDMRNRQQGGDQYKVTNQDQKITNRDQPIQNKSEGKMPMDDDADRTSSERDEPEIDAPHNQPAPTEKKLPKM